MTDKPTVYLAGPIRCVEDPSSWREAVKDASDTFMFVDPLDNINGHEVTILPSCRRTEAREADDTIVFGDEIRSIDKMCIANADALLVGGLDPNVPARGTMREIGLALDVHEIPVVICKSPDVALTEMSAWTWDVDAIVSSVDTALTSLADELS